MVKKWTLYSFNNFLDVVNRLYKKVIRDVIFVDLRFVIKRSAVHGYC